MMQKLVMKKINLQEKKSPIKPNYKKLNRVNITRLLLKVNHYNHKMKTEEYILHLALRYRNSQIKAFSQIL